MSGRIELNGRKVLVTGASGFLGSRTVAALAKRGWGVHALVRNSSRTDHLELPGVTLFRGDVAVAESLHPAFAGIDSVIHAAADTRGDRDGGERSTVRGTRNILDLSSRYPVRKLVYISSCSVYGVADYPPGEVVTEESPLERFPERRGAYSHAKFRAEQLVTGAMDGGSLSIACLRPGTIYGPGGEVYTPMLGLSIGRKVFAVIGNGAFVLPLVYVDNMVGAILAALDNPLCTNRIYNVVDPEHVTKKAYMEGLVQKLHPGSRTVYIPYSFLKALVFLQEKASRAIGREPALSLYRLNSSQNPVLYDAAKIRLELAWQPSVTVADAFGSLIRHGQDGNYCSFVH